MPPVPETLFSQRRRIVWGDTDPEGIVYTPRISHFAIEAIELWYRERLGIEWITGPRAPFVSLACSFLSPMTSADTLNIQVLLRRTGRSSLTFGVIAHTLENRRLCWTAEIVCAFVDKASFRSRPIPEELRAALQAEVDLAALKSDQGSALKPAQGKP